MQYIKFLILSFLMPASIFAVPRKTRVEVVNRTNQKAVVQNVTVVPQQTKAIITTELIALKQQGNNVFFKAIANDSVVEVANLVRNGFDINQGDMPALLIAILLNKQNVTKFLVDSGAVIKDLYIEVALKNKNMSAALLLANKTNGLNKKYNQSCLLVHAMSLGDFNAIISLIQKSNIENIINPDFFIYSFFDLEQTIKIFKEIINRGISPNDLWAKSSWSYLLRHFIGNNIDGVEDIIQFLINNGASPNYVTDHNQYIHTPLSLSLTSVRALKKLISLGADVNCKFGYANDLRTPLSSILNNFFGNDNSAVIFILLEHGATL